MVRDKVAVTPKVDGVVPPSSRVKCRSSHHAEQAEVGRGCFEESLFLWVQTGVFPPTESEIPCRGISLTTKRIPEGRAALTHMC